MSSAKSVPVIYVAVNLRLSKQALKNPFSTSVSHVGEGPCWPMQSLNKGRKKATG